MKKIKKYVFIILVLVIVIVSVYVLDRLVIMHTAASLLKKEIGERYKDFHVNSIQKDEGTTVILFVNNDVHVLGSHFLVILKTDGTSEVIHGE